MSHEPIFWRRRAGPSSSTSMIVRFCEHVRKLRRPMCVVTTRESTHVDDAALHDRRFAALSRVEVRHLSSYEHCTTGLRRTTHLVPKRFHGARRRLHVQSRDVVSQARGGPIFVMLEEQPIVARSDQQSIRHFPQRPPIPITLPYVQLLFGRIVA